MSAAPELLGLVLAGGRSERMGRDKASLKQDGTAFLERAYALLEPLASRVYVSARADQQDDLRYRYPRLNDDLTDVGPAAGVLAAHAAFPEAAWLVIACDMPLLDHPVLEHLVSARDRAAGATAFVAPADGAPEPLCAIYEPATLAAFAEAVAAGGSPSLRRLLEGCEATLLRWPDERVLTNVNTPADLDRIC